MRYSDFYSVGILLN